MADEPTEEDKLRTAMQVQKVIEEMKKREEKAEKGKN
jgi:hypothetical protein